MSSKNDNNSTTGNAPDIVELSFAQMEGQCYKCGAKGHLIPRMSQKDNGTWTG